MSWWQRVKDYLWGIISDRYRPVENEEPPPPPEKKDEEPPPEEEKKAKEYHDPAPFAHDPKAGCYIRDDRGAVLGPGWALHPRPQLYRGSGHYISRHTTPPPSKSKTKCVWSFRRPKAGRLEVWVSYWATGNRAEHVEYIVDCGLLRWRFRLSQWEDPTVSQGRRWRKLGEIQAPAGSTVTVTVGYPKKGRHSVSVDACGLRRKG